MNKAQRSANQTINTDYSSVESMETDCNPPAAVFTISDQFACEPVSPGTATGLVNVITDMEDLGVVADGTILVCPNASQKLTVVMPRLKALIAESGGMLSFGFRAAINSGIPAVRGTKEILRSLNTGDCVRIDGSTGQVQVLQKAE
ncbi:MAG: hypothetical protein HKM93_09830 [Desulfobacteraceae bacterium]|nr:hypothetical protein [Desulfobacteraceae bacterium]